MLGDSAVRRATVTALRDTGLTVLDVEVVRLRPRTDVRAAEPLLEAGAELGALFLLTTVEDPDPPSRAESLGALCGLAASYGLRCMVEPMVFSAVKTPAEALRLLADAGAPSAGLLVDTLHLVRAGGSPADLAGVDPALMPYLQLSDAAAGGAAPSREAAVREAAGHRLAPGDGVLPLAEIVRTTQPGTPLSLEVPHPRSQQDPAAWLLHLAGTTRRWLAAVS